MFWCKDISLPKWLLGYCVWLLGSGLAAVSEDIIKTACQYEWYKPTPKSLWLSNWKICLFEFALLGCLIMVARAWLGDVYVDSGLAVCFPESNEPTLMSLWRSVLKICLFWFWLLGWLIMVARAWLGSVYVDSSLAVWSHNQMSQAPCLCDAQFWRYASLDFGC